MTSPVSRAQFLRGDLSGRRSPQRAPWALGETAFVESCQRSGACVAACPEKILEKGRGGFPQINFALGACTFCGKCREACGNGAFDQGAESPPWRVKAVIQMDCLTYSQVVCRICGERCPAAAIRFPPKLGGVAQPLVDVEKCTGCGECFAPCPKNAIRLFAEMN